MDLSTAILCDFAQVRDGLLFVASGAVTRIHRPDLPAHLGLMVGLVVEVPLDEAHHEHAVATQVLTREGLELASLVTTFKVGTDGLYRNEVQQVPLVLSLLGVQTTHWGTHVVRVALDGDVLRRLTFYVVPSGATRPGGLGPPARPQATPAPPRPDLADATPSGA